MRDNSGSPYVASIASDFTTANTTATNVTGMSFPVGANEVHTFEFRLNIGKASGTAGIKVALAVPTGSTLKAMVDGTTSGPTATTSSVITASATLTAEIYSTVANSNGVMLIYGRVDSAGTPGTVQLQVASVTSQNAIIGGHSSLVAEREA